MKRWRIVLWSAGLVRALGVVMPLGLVVLMVNPASYGPMGVADPGSRRRLDGNFAAAAGGALVDQRWWCLLAAAIVTVALGWTQWLHNRSRNDHDYATSGQRNVTWLTPVEAELYMDSRLSDAVQDSLRTRCYDPGRGTFVLRSCGGL